MDTFRYPEAAAHGGRLFYRGPVPVLVVDGDPAAIGRQARELALVPAGRLLDYPLDYLRFKIPISLVPRLLWRLLRRPCRRLYRNIPERFQTEVEAMAGPDRTRLVAGNTLFDMEHMGLRPLFGCSSVVAGPARSATGGLLFGRNLDFEPLGYLHEYSLVTVYRPAAWRLGFASVGFPGIVGCFSGMNAAGLCLARHEVMGPNVRRTFDPAGVPFAVALRSVLETCRTVSEAVDLLTRTRHVTVNIVVLADPTEARVAELTPDGVFVRDLPDGVAGCANHFRHPTTRHPAQVNRFRTLDRQAALDDFASTAGPGLGVADVWSALDRVHQGALTVQSMLFEPAARSLHVAFGPGPTTTYPPTRIDLAELWG
jgi:isopenicillin-N N-acyltransferase-like protein